MTEETNTAPATETPKVDTFVAQVGGDHYQSPLQHWDWVETNRIPYTIAQAIKYLGRWRSKGGKVDLAKSISFIDKVVALNKAGVMKSAPYGLKVSAAEYSTANKLGAVEASATALLAGWRRPADLAMAKTMIQTLIDAPEAA